MIGMMSSEFLAKGCFLRNLQGAAEEADTAEGEGEVVDIDAAAGSSELVVATFAAVEEVPTKAAAAAEE